MTAQTAESHVIGESELENMRSLWDALTPQRRWLVIGATVCVFGAILLMARNAGQTDTALLFGGLDARASGDVITALDQQGVAYEVRGNAIYVPTAQRDVLRMTLAGQGLPMTGNRGYELLDQLSGFSTTSQMFDAAYWRAKEGELARTIVASPHVESARVHISTLSQRPFERDQTQTAAVTIASQRGLGPDHIRALQFLVASAVPRLAPEDVSIIDDVRGLISDAEGANAQPNSDARAEALRLQAERLLAARVGAGNAVVEVTVDATTQSEQITERRVDPDSRVAISTEVTETAGTSSDSRGQAVTVASNLPDGEANGNAGASTNENSESRTITNYDMSETERQLVRGPGEIRRLTVAVLINDVTSVSDEGVETITPRSPDELADLGELVASAVGLDTERGDVLTLRSMPFERTAFGGSDPVAAPASAPLDTMQIIQLGTLAAVALILGLFVVRPILMSQARSTAQQSDEARDPVADFAPEMAMAMNDGGLDSFAADAPVAQAAESDVSTRLQQMMAERQPEALQVLQDWIDDTDLQRKAS